MDKDSQAFIGLDIGTSLIKVVSMQLNKSGINVTGVGISKASGMHKGMVTDIEQTSNDIRAAFDDLNKKTKVPIKKVILGIPTGYLQIDEQRGLLELSKLPREITEKDISELASIILDSKDFSDRDYVGIVAEEFIVDKFDGISDPLGMMGTTLSLKALIYTIPKTIFRNIIAAVKRSGLQIDNFVLNPISLAEVALSKERRDVGSNIIDTGSGKTSVHTFYDGFLMNSSTIFEGGSNVTSDIAKVLQISESDAESVKIDYGNLKSSQISNNESFVIKTIDQTKNIEIRDRYLSDIITARFDQMFGKVKSILINDQTLNLPGGSILTGGNSAIPGTSDEVEKVLGRKVNIYVPNLIGLRSQIFSVVYGMIVHTINLSRIQKIIDSQLKSYSLDKDFRKEKKDIKTDSEEIKIDTPIGDKIDKVVVARVDESPKVNNKKKKRSGGIIKILKRWFHNLFE